MAKKEVVTTFLKKSVLTVVVALFLYSVFSRIFVNNGTIDLFLIWLALRSIIWHRQEVYTDTDWLWYLRYCWSCCAQHRSRRAER